MVRLKHFSDVINITKSWELDSAMTNDIQEKVFFESPQSEQTETRERRFAALAGLSWMWYCEAMKPTLVALLHLYPPRTPSLAGSNETNLSRTLAPIPT